MLSDYTFFINCSASMFSASMQLEPSLVKEMTNHKQNPSQTLAQPLHGIAKPRKKVHLSTTGELKSSEYVMKSPVCTGYRQWRGVGCANDWYITPCKLICLPLNYVSYMFSLTCFMKVVPFYDRVLLHIRIK